MQNNNLWFRFGHVTVRIKWIPEGWLVMMIVKNSNISMDIVPDKEHAWKPRKEDWQNISIFAIKSKAIKTPKGWLLYIINKPKSTFSDGYRAPVTVSTKYIHDPENIFNPDETEKKDDTNQENDHEENVDKRTCLDLILDDDTKKPEPIEGYQIRVQSVSYSGTNNSPVKAETLDELKDILKNKYHITLFTLISKPLAFDSSGAVYNQRRQIPLTQLNDDDCQWLAESSSYDVRHLE